MLRSQKFCTLLALVALAAFSPASGVVGKWSGRYVAHISVPASAPTAAPSASQLKALQNLLDKVRIMLVISANGKYVATTKLAGRPDYVTKGSWKLKGKKLTLQPTGKPSSETGTLVAGGKSIRMSVPASMSKAGIKGYAIFTRS